MELMAKYSHYRNMKTMKLRINTKLILRLGLTNKIAFPLPTAHHLLGTGLCA